MKNKIIIISTLLAGLFTLNSCLKDDADNWKEDVTGKMYATIFSPGFHSNSVQPIPDEVTFSFMVNIASDALPKTDVTMNFAFDNAAISAYDTLLRRAAYDSTAMAAAIAAGDTTDDGKPLWKNYKPFPSAVLLDPVVTIPAGSRTGTVSFKVARADTVQLNVPKLDPIKGNYMLAVSMTSVSPESVLMTSNMKTYLLALPLANEYEGIYSNDGYFKHPTAGSSRALDKDKELFTVNKNTCKLGLADLADPATGQYYIKVIVESATIVVGGKTVNKVTIVNVNPAAPLVLEQRNVADDLMTFDPGIVFNYYDPSAKKFVLRYHYNNGGAWREIQEVLTKK